ncbi:TetR family transcriptional regulator [Antricoccus suffuscus]|uniref:TetR family transcriptional regulator n=1 Tax=Antricoccus suffuscus TaxID=1629062 RepID=A0A2T1A6X3_9ACTN|nr:TetR/AcrR family transcriptional regulator [Antricoccus suffuscus]PRZ44346.1 TetR family transcriptional regulator [Antricoccus suffuscus]
MAAKSPQRQPVVGGRAAVSPTAVREAALTLFAERGYHGTALSQIAKALDIQTPSLYNHMASKQDLLVAILQDTTDRVLAEYDAAVDGVEDVGERLSAATYTYALRHATHPREAVIVNRDATAIDEPVRAAVYAKRRKHADDFRELIQKGVESGRFDVENATVAAFAILEMCVSIARWFDPDGPVSAEEIARQHGEFALRIVGVRSALSACSDGAS